MNRCFLIGKILNEPEFDFLYMNKKISIAYFFMGLSNGNIVKVFGYDEKADYIYRDIKKEEMVMIDGKIRVEDKVIEVEINKIDKI